MPDIYGAEWYRAIAPGAKRSAELFVPELLARLAPTSVVDIGCGTGVWLAEFAAAGVPRLLGVDGDWVPRTELAIPVSAFLVADLRDPLPGLGARFDLALCLEVAEHLPPERAPSLIEELTALSDAVLFSAAIPGQGGEGHLNEQPHGYWETLFRKHGYRPIWTGAELEQYGAEWWYARNARLYVNVNRQSPDGQRPDPGVSGRRADAIVDRAVMRQMRKRVTRLIARLRRGRFHAPGSPPGPYVLNDAHYWDEYVRRWEQSGQGGQSAVLGEEWKNEEIFLSRLRKYSYGRRTALEIGCGGGRITRHAVAFFEDVHAADISTEMLRKCEEGVPAGNLSLHHTDGFTLKEFADASVDLVFSHDVFVHFSSLQIYPYFAEIARVLRPEGVAVISFYNFRTHFPLFKEMGLRFARERMLPPHMRIHFVTEEMIRLIVEDLGMEMVEVEATNYLIAVFRRPRDLPPTV